MTYLAQLLTRSRRLFVALVKAMLPVMIAVEIGRQLGWIDALGRTIAPAMGWIGLPPEAGIIWITGVFVGIWRNRGADRAGARTRHQRQPVQRAVRDDPVAHALPVEQAIVRRAGSSFWATAALRIGVALAYGAARRLGLQADGNLSRAARARLAAGFCVRRRRRRRGDPGWIEGTAFSLAVTFAIIVGLLVLLDALERSGATRRITAALSPAARVGARRERRAGDHGRRAARARTAAH